MIENNNIREREKIAREIEKTSESICKKHRALKTGKIENDRSKDAFQAYHWAAAKDRWALAW